jgi:hypothetical protein
MSEIWKAFNAEVEVSNFGSVRTIDRKVKYSDKYINAKGRTLKPAIDKKGYLRVAFKQSGKHTTFKVHRLVAQLFVSNDFNKPMVNHKDGNKKNNNFENLEWVTNSENIQHAFDNGLMKAKRLHESPRSKQTKEGIERMCYLRSLGMSYQSIANEVGVAKCVAMKNIKNYELYSNANTN